VGSRDGGIVGLAIGVGGNWMPKGNKIWVANAGVGNMGLGIEFEHVEMILGRSLGAMTSTCCQCRGPCGTCGETPRKQIK